MYYLGILLALVVLFLLNVSVIQLAVWLAYGLVVGFLASLLVDGASEMGPWKIAGLGIIGSLVGGSLAELATSNGWLIFAASVLAAAALVCLLARRNRPHGEYMVL